MAEKKTRRRKGEGSITRHHNHPTCPPSVDGERPKHKCQGLWRARVTVKLVGGKTTTKVVYGKSEPEITRKKALLEQQSRSGRVATAKPGTVGEWIDAYYEEHKEDWKPSTRGGYRTRIDVWIKPHLGHIRLDRLDEDDVEEMYEQMRRKRLAEGTIRQAHAVLSKAMRVAKRRKLVATNIMREVESPSGKPTKKRRPLTPDEAFRVIDAAGDNPRAAFALMTGMRQGECLALRWLDLRLEGSTACRMPHVVVTKAVSRGEPGQGWQEHTPKTEAGTGRVVPLLPELVVLLRRWRDLEFKAGSDEASFIWHSAYRRDVPLNRGTDLRRWAAWLEDADVAHTPLHAARNTTSQLLQNAGVEDGVVQEILGHSNVSMTRLYQSGNLTAVVSAMETLGDYMKDNQRSEAA